MVSKEPFHFSLGFLASESRLSLNITNSLHWFDEPFDGKLRSGIYLRYFKMECLLFYYGSKGCRDYFGSISFWHAWNHMNQSVVSQRNHAEKHSSHQQLTAGEPTRCSERSGWKHDLMAWKTYEFIIYKIFQHISYFSQLHLASGGKGQKWKPRVIQQSSGKFFYSRPFWTWKCIYKWLVPFPFLLWGEVGPKTARMCQCVSHLVTFLSLHSRKLTNIVPEKWWFLNSPLLCVN